MASRSSKASVRGKPVSASRTEVTQLMMPNDANFAGYVQGGTILRLADYAAYACASRHAGAYCVTASVDRVDFRTPIRVGDLVTFKASINYVGRTSMEVGITVIAEDPITRRQEHASSCYITMVAVNTRLRPRSVPPLVLETADDRRRYAAAARRRDLRRGA